MHNDERSPDPLAQTIGPPPTVPPPTVPSEVQPPTTELPLTLPPTQDGQSRGEPDPSLPQIPGYEILHLIDRGGMGAVYRARQIHTNRIVALKMLLSGEYASDEDIARFRTEGEAIARLQHPGIVAVYEVGTHQGRPFMSLEFCAGGSLARKLNGQPLPPRQAAELLRLLAQAMQAAHLANILHRDLKPANVLLTVATDSAPGVSKAAPADAKPLSLAERQPKITDFGLARKLDEAGRTQTGAIMGTPSYMAPEQAQGLKNLGPAVDIYGLGAILYECLTGRPPFTGSDMLALLVQVIEREPVGVRQLNASVPRDLETICLKCLHKQPEKRYASAAALADDLDRFLKGQSVQARPVSRLERGWRWCRRNPLLTSLSVLVLAFLLTTAIAGPVIAYQQATLREAANEQRLEAIREATEKEKHRQLAENSAREALRQEKAAQQALYAARQQLAMNAWRENRMDRLKEVLARQLPTAGQEDLRGFEWFYLDRLSGSPGPRWQQSGLMINGVVVSPDSKTVLSVGFGGQCIAWDVASGQKKWDTGKAFRASINAAAFSPDGKTVALAGHFGQLQLWTHDGKPIAPLSGHRAQVFGVAFSPDGKTLASASADLTVRLWDVANARPLAVLGEEADAEAPPPGITTRQQTDPLQSVSHTNLVWQASWSPDGQRLATCSTDGSVKVWSMTDRKLLQTLMGHEGVVVAVRWSPDGRHLASGSRPLIGTVGGEGKLWNVETGKVQANFRHPSGGVHAIAFTPDGFYVLTAGMDRTVRVWRKDGRPVSEHRGFRDEVIGLDVGGGGRWAVAGSRAGEVVAFDLDTQLGKYARSVEGRGRLAFDAQGRLALHQSGEVKWLDLDTLTPLQNWKSVVSRPAEQKLLTDLNAFVIREDGQSAHGGHAYEGACPVVWRTASGQLRHILQGHNTTVGALAFLPGDRLASGDEEGHIRIWNGQDGKLLASLQPFKGPVRFLHSCAGGSLWAGGRLGLPGSEANRAKLHEKGWLARIEQDKLVWQEATSSAVRDGQVLARGSTLVVAFAGGILSWRDVHTGKETRRLPLAVEAIHLRFSPDERRLAVATPAGSVHVFESTLGEELLLLEDSQAPISDLLFYPDGKRLAVLTNTPLFGGELTIWDGRPSGKPRPLSGPDLAWHKDRQARAVGRGEPSGAARQDSFALRYHVEKLQQLEPNQRNWYLYLLALDQEAGDYRSAIRRLEDFLKRWPNDAAMWYDLGNARREVGDVVGSEAAFRKSIELDAEMAEVHCNLGLLLGRQGRFKEAVSHLERGNALGQERKKRGGGWGYPSDRWLARHRRLEELASRYGQRKDFKDLPSDDKEDLLEVLLLIGRPLAAVELAAPRSDQSPSAVVIGAALRCAEGQGDAKDLPAEKRSEWRDKALAWLRLDLQKVRQGGPQLRANFYAFMHGHPYLQLARPDQQVGWPEKDRSAWKTFWAEVKALRE